MRFEHFDDDSFRITDRNLSPNDANPVIRFGPLSTSLSKLFEDGFVLAVYGWERSRLSEKYIRRNIYLTRELQVQTERYKVARVFHGEIMKADTLSDFVRNDIQLIKRGAAPSNRLPCPSNDNPDPWEMIMEKYPQKPVTMIGNMTIHEAVRQSLKGGTL